MVIKVLGLSVGLLLFTSGMSFAGEFNFESTAEGIAKKLLRSTDIARKRTAKTRSISDLEKKVRGLKVVVRKAGREVVETITVPVNRSSGFVNLAVRFSVNLYALRPESFLLLDELAKALVGARLRDISLFVNGHTDSDGAEGSNLQLSLNRALAVKQYLLVNHAILPKRLIVVGYGESIPLVPNTTVSNKQLNRRVEIVVIQ